MDVKNISKSPKEKLKEFLLNHPNEVFKNATLNEKVTPKLMKNTTRYHLRTLVTKEEKITRAKPYGKQFYFYGHEKAVKELREMIDCET